MNDDFHTAFDSEIEGLSTLERVTLRNQLLAFMSEHAARAPWYIRTFDRLDRLYGTPRRYRMRGVFASAFALVLIIGIGTSFAAERALPGEALYPIKIRVTEPIAGVLIRSNVEKARWDTELVSRRLAEAEKLAAAGRLTPAARADIQESISVSTADFNENVAKLADSKSPAKVVEAQSNLEASLVGHEQVLAALADEDDRSALAPVLAMVNVHKAAVTAERASAEANVKEQGSEEVRHAAMITRQRADQAIRAVTDALLSAPRDLATTTASVRASAAIAQHTADEGDSHLEHGDYGDAFATFQTAERVARSARVHIDAIENIRDALIGEKATSNATTATSTIKHSDSD